MYGMCSNGYGNVISFVSTPMIFLKVNGYSKIKIWLQVNLEDTLYNLIANVIRDLTTIAQDIKQSTL